MQFSGSVPPPRHTPPSFALPPTMHPPFISGALFTIPLTHAVSRSSIYQAVPFHCPPSPLASVVPLCNSLWLPKMD